MFQTTFVMKIKTGILVQYFVSKILPFLTYKNHLQPGRSQMTM